MTLSLDDRLVVSFDIAAHPDVVWSYLRDPVKIRRWFAWDGPDLEADIQRIVVGGPQVSETPAVGRARAGDDWFGGGDSTITDVPTGLVRTLTWKGGDILTISPAPADTSTVRHARHAHEPAHGPERTHLTLTRRSHERVGPYDGVHDEVDEEWIACAQQLRFAVELHPGEDRHTLRATGLDAGPLNNRLLDRIGMHGLRGVPLGAHVEVHRPDGTLLGGTIWHKTAHQVGIHLHGLTESLLIVHTTPAASHPPHGLVAAVLSVYGVDDALLAEIERRWAGWWGQPQGHGAASSAPILIGRGIPPLAATHPSHRRPGSRSRR